MNPVAEAEEDLELEASEGAMSSEQVRRAYALQRIRIYRFFRNSGADYERTGERFGISRARIHQVVARVEREARDVAMGRTVVGWNDHLSTPENKPLSDDDAACQAKAIGKLSRQVERLRAELKEHKNLLLSLSCGLDSYNQIIQSLQGQLKEERNLRRAAEDALEAARPVKTS